MQQICAHAGYRFISIQDSFKALPDLISNKPDIIFLDLGMPIVNGYEICSQIRRVSILKDIPVIILTGRDGLIDRMRAKVVGATAFLTKPIDIEEIVTTLMHNFPDYTVVSKNPSLTEISANSI
jgi:DNA-binding response OmpR family regulator